MSDGRLIVAPCPGGVSLGSHTRAANVADHTELEARVAAVEARLAALTLERGEVQAELLELVAWSPE